MKRKALQRYRGFIWIMVLTIIVSMPVFPVGAAGIGADVDASKDYKDHWAKSIIEQWLSEGWAQGYEDGSFRPDRMISRAETAVFLYRVMNQTKAPKPDFADVSSAAWYAKEVAQVAALGWMKGDSSRSFAPGRSITRQELAVIAANVLNLASDGSDSGFNDIDSAADWSKAAILAAVRAGIIQGYVDGSFRPLTKATRAETMAILSRIKQRQDEAGIFYGKAGIYGPSEGTQFINGNVTISSGGIRLRNMIIDGNLTLAREIGEGEASLHNVTVKGATYVLGGRAELNGQFGEVVLDDHLSALVLKNGEIDRLIIRSGADGSIVTLESGTTVNHLEAYAEASIKGKGQIHKAMLAANGMRLEQKPAELVVKDGITAMIGGMAITGPYPSSGTGSPVGTGGGPSQPLPSIAISAMRIFVEKGAAADSHVTVDPADATLRYVSENTDIAVIDPASGVITGIETGTATIAFTASKPGYAGGTGSFEVTVVPSGTAVISKDEFYDKTLAAIIGHVGGTLTGYEFVTEVPLSDDYFEMGKGPYSGRSGDKYPQPQNVRIENDMNGRILSDDDYHIDFFNQHILDVHGLNVTYQDITQEWRDHQVSDWGGGWGALNAINTRNMIAPSTGLSEYNRFYWVTEAYIENDTLGIVAPGMPLAARDLTGKFASLTGEFDAVTWAEFLSVMYSLAYFETDARTVMDKASLVLPRDSWPYQLYRKVKELHASYPDDWRAAQQELVAIRRMVYGRDNIQAIPDINNAITMLAIEYGNNDYESTARIASLAGFDAETNASTAMGIMGILKGMAGTPQVLKDTIYADGEGVYINDKNFEPHIRLDYPDEQKFTDLAKLYQRNAETMIAVQGGSIVDDAYYYIRKQTLDETKVYVPIRNQDFEAGDLSGWNVWQPGAAPYKIMADGTGSAFSGQWKGLIETDDDVNEGKLYVALENLEPGAIYRAKAYLQASKDHTAQFYVQTAAGSVYADVVSKPSYYVGRSIEFIASADGKADIGLLVPAGSVGRKWAAIDNLTVERIDKESSFYEAEAGTVGGGQTGSSATASGGAFIGGLDNIGNYISFDQIAVPASGEYRLRVNYANGWSDESRLNLYVGGELQGAVTFPRTKAWGEFSGNFAEIPVVLNEGMNTIRLQKDENTGYVQIDYIEISEFPVKCYRTPGTETDGSTRTSTNGIMDGKAPRLNLLLNGDFEGNPPGQAPLHWGTWPGGSGNDRDAAFTERDSHNGEWRLTHWKGVPYEVYTDQTIAGLENGLYTVKAFVMTGGGQNAVFMDVKNYGGAELIFHIPATGYPNWLEIEIAGVQVVNGQLTVGFYSDANAGNWLAVDDVIVYKE